MSHYRETLSDNGAIQNKIYVNDDELICQDVMPAERVQAVLDDNADIRNSGARNRQAEGTIAARIPLPLWNEWKKEWAEKRSQYMNWQEFLVIRIRDRDYSKLRTTEGKIHVPENVRTSG